MEELKEEDKETEGYRKMQKKTKHRRMRQQEEGRAEEELKNTEVRQRRVVSAAEQGQNKGDEEEGKEGERVELVVEKK